jgi:hypothetical protein
MKLYTTFAPSKICWEVTCVRSKGTKAHSNWQKELPLIEESLKTLSTYGISGIRLSIYPNELTQDGKHFNWAPIDTILEMTQKYKIQVILCIGPFQYPYYPGIYLPPQMLSLAFDNNRSLDTTTRIWDYGIDFLTRQVERYNDDKRVIGYHLANEWPSAQNIQQKEQIKTTISEAFMIESSKYLARTSEKPVFMNTYIDAANRKALKKAYTELFSILNRKAYLGFDIYPSQETWQKAPLQKLRRWFESYFRSYAKCERMFPECTMYFCEVEAQPWGDGRSWYAIISAEADPQNQVLQYTMHSLEKTWHKHLAKSPAGVLSLWGSDFWLSAKEMGVTWPLEQVKTLKSLKLKG